MMWFLPAVEIVVITIKLFLLMTQIYLEKVTARALKNDEKMMSIMLTETFVEHFGSTKTIDAKESALLLGVNNKNAGH